MLNKNKLGLQKYSHMKKTSTARQLHDHFSKMNISPSGFVPTMGALHNGHISLVETAMRSCRMVTVSIFVNPTQFNDKEDLKNYPRTIDRDLELLGKVMREEDIVFIPDVHEIYPEEDKRMFNFGHLNKVMEGTHRPGHFNGVAQVVSRLFDIVKPDIAFFGQKDFQQLTIIRELVRQTGNRVKIVGCPIIREIDGLAMSSRNQLLEPEIRKNAAVIYKTISEASNMPKDSEIAEIIKYVSDNINGVNGFRVEYFEIVDDIKLIPLKNKSEVKKEKRYFGCIAVMAGKIRLIDNIEISLL
jgi:pantoate--beta-alanine ligase